MILCSKKFRLARNKINNEKRQTNKTLGNLIDTPSEIYVFPDSRVGDPLCYWHWGMHASMYSTYISYVHMLDRHLLTPPPLFRSPPLALFLEARPPHFRLGGWFLFSQKLGSAIDPGPRPWCKGPRPLPSLEPRPQPPPPSSLEALFFAKIRFRPFASSSSNRWRTDLRVPHNLPMLGHLRSRIAPPFALLTLFF